MSASIPLLFAALLLPWSALAAQWQATQGDVVRLEIHDRETVDAVEYHNRSWPVKKLADGRWQGWIGIDLKQQPGRYDIAWKDGNRTVATDTLRVRRGEFRISRIQVKKKMAAFDKPTLARIRAEVRALKAAYLIQVEANPDIVMHGRPVEGVKSTPFGAQRFVNGEARSAHAGIDIAAPAGTPVKAPLAGKVLLVADMYLNGNSVVLGHGNGLVSVYCHMQSVAVREGDWLETNQLIGKVGSTGRSTGPHLHWGVRFHNARVNPEALL